ncbi:hypothetical protein DUNSADRAFT_10046, partial [Dunaliella salina]
MQLIHMNRKVLLTTPRGVTGSCCSRRPQASKRTLGLMHRSFGSNKVALRNHVRAAASGRPDANLDESLQLVKGMLEDATNQHMGDSMHAIYGAAAALES